LAKNRLAFYKERGTKRGEYSLLKVMTRAMVWQRLSEKFLAIYQAGAPGMT